MRLIERIAVALGNVSSHGLRRRIDALSAEVAELQRQLRHEKHLRLSAESLRNIYHEMANDRGRDLNDLRGRMVDNANSAEH